MFNFEKKYADILSGLIHYGQTERKLTKSMLDDLLDFVDEDTFNKVYRASSQFPDIERVDGRVYQTCSFIGYLRGINDTLDSISHWLKYALIEYPDEVLIKEKDDLVYGVSSDE